MNRLPVRANDRRALLTLLALAFLLRAGLAVFDPSIAFADEIYQYQEPAHRWLTGLGIPTWEWTQHLRSWLFPGLVLPVMAGVRLISDNPALYWDTIGCVVSALSLPVVWVAYQWGLETGGRQGAIIAGATAAVSFQLVYFSSHLLMDTVATDLLLPALYACREYRLRNDRRGLAWGAALLGLLIYARPQLAPVLLLPAAAILLAARKNGHVTLCLAWGLGPLLALGALDWFTLGRPLQSVWLYVYVNLFSVGDEFGVQPWYWYFGNNLLVWSSATVPILYFSWLASKQFRLEYITAWLIVATMSAIAHKEQRFMLPAQAILLVLTGVGIGEFRAAREGLFADPAVYLVLIGATSLGLALLPSFLPEIQRWDTEIKVKNRVMADPQACGIYFMPRLSIMAFGGYTGARDGVRLYDDRFDAPAISLRNSNYILTRTKLGHTLSLPASYAPQSCAPTTDDYQVCVYRRTGGCG